MLQQSKEVGDSQQCSFDYLPHPIRREPTNAALPIIKYKHNTIQVQTKTQTLIQLRIQTPAPTLLGATLQI